jgi:hypothetical protein
MPARIQDRPGQRDRSMVFVAILRSPFRAAELAATLALSSLK